MVLEPAQLPVDVGETWGQTTVASCQRSCHTAAMAAGMKSLAASGMPFVEAARPSAGSRRCQLTQECLAAWKLEYVAHSAAAGCTWSAWTAPHAEPAAVGAYAAASSRSVGAVVGLSRATTNTTKPPAGCCYCCCHIDPWLIVRMVDRDARRSMTV